MCLSRATVCNIAFFISVNAAEISWSYALAADRSNGLVHFGVFWLWMDTTLAASSLIRRSISLPSEMAEKIDAIAASRHVSANRAIVDLLEDAINSYEQRRTAFLELADRFQKSTNPAETKRLREELARMTFGG
jgi:hypothetical protein